MTKFELVIPCEWGNDFFQKVVSVFEKNVREYAWARHVADENAGFEHWHIGADLHSSRTVDDVYKWFAGIDRLQKNSVQNIRSHWKTYLTYIMHKTKDAIAKGKSAPSEWGGNADMVGAVSDYELKGECDRLIEDILAGSVREYDFYAKTELVNEIIKKGWYNKVKQAFESYTKNQLTRSSSRTEERKQMWIFGKAGSGKTELAKWVCRSEGYRDVDIYVTSSGQNPFDDYKGQPCVIVDDIDAETMTPKTMLKLADCFTGSAVKARYSNKVILADVVVFTSTVSPSSWWKRLADDKVDGNVFQLLRRLNRGSWHIDGNKIDCTFYDGQGEIALTSVLELPQEIAEKVCSSESAVQKSLDWLKQRFKVTAVDSRGNSLNAEFDANGNFTGKFSPFDDAKGGK